MAKGNTPSPKGGTSTANTPVYGYLGGGTKGGGATAAQVSKSIKKSAVQQSQQQPQKQSPSTSQNPSPNDSQQIMPTQQVAQVVSFNDVIPQGWNNNVITDHIYTAAESQQQKLAQGKRPFKVASVQSMTGVSKQEATKMVSAVEAYSDTAYGAMRGQQIGKIPPTPDVQAKIANVENFIAKSPKFKGTTYRGVNLADSVVTDLISSEKKGMAIEMNGMSSWTSKQRIAENFSSKGNGNSRVVFRCSQGQPMGTDIAHLSRFTNEREVLVSGLAKYKITGHTKQGDVYYFDVVAVKS